MNSEHPRKRRDATMAIAWERLMILKRGVVKTKDGYPRLAIAQDTPEGIWHGQLKPEHLDKVRPHKHNALCQCAPPEDYGHYPF